MYRRNESTPGSSPRMRGARSICYWKRSAGRTIPADAGSTRRFISRYCTSEDHPRGCGEHMNENKVRTRKQGIIPADAGSTDWKTNPQTQVKDHPRGCGEHNILHRSSLALSGSSPRMRGAPASSGLSGAPLGIIPADAGSTLGDIIRDIGHTDHPRGCGEHIKLPYVAHPWDGSSPRMRGAPGRRIQPGQPRRIIPADAGSTDGIGSMYTY